MSIQQIFAAILPGYAELSRLEKSRLTRWFKNNPTVSWAEPELVPEPENYDPGRPLSVRDIDGPPEWRHGRERPSEGLYPRLIIFDNEDGACTLYTFEICDPVDVKSTHNFVPKQFADRRLTSEL